MQASIDAVAPCSQERAGRRSTAKRATAPRTTRAMRWVLLTALVGLSSPAAPARAAWTTVWDNGPSSNRVDIIFMGDGYTAAQINTVYTAHISAMLNHMFDAGQDPFPRYRNFFNVHRIDVISNQSGADVPPLGIFRDTALDASYYWDGVTDRLLYVNQAKANGVLFNELFLAGAPFSAEMRLVTVNDTRYGGGGGLYAVYAGGNFSAPEIALHELGHSFSSLADEYDYGGAGSVYLGGEPSAVNITKSPGGEKWAHWLGYDQPGIGIIGAYEGAGYYPEGLYRPSLNSKMRSLNRPFDAVSREKIILDIYNFVDPLDGWLANDATIGGHLPLWVDVVDPEVIQVEWYVDGILVPGANEQSFLLSDWGFGPGTYEVTARAFDDTDWVRIQLDKLTQSVTWSVHAVPEPSTLVLAAVGPVVVLVLARRTRPLVYSTIAVLAASMACGTVAPPARGGLFVSPIGGTPYQDWTIVNYVDLAPGAGVVDYRGGNYTYNGHNAIDYTLANFAAMDAGISVNAAAAGTVIAVHDGEYDRWSRVNPNPGHQANYVVIDHGEGIITEYFHLKKHSILVSVGQAVTAGQPIGEVGSSGNSSDAHLHFAVYEHGQVVETYLDPDRWWIEPLPYSGDVPGSLDHGVVNHIPTTAELVDRPVGTEVFRQIDGPLQAAFLWMHLHGIRAGDTFDAYFYRPGGDLFSHSHWTAPQIRYGWWIAAVLLPNEPDLGTWQIDFRHNGATLVADSFRVVVPEPASFLPAALALVGLTALARTTKARRRRQA